MGLSFKIILFAFLALNTKAQNIQLLSYSDKNTPVAFASLTFYNDTLLLGGTYADENGLINCILPENCSIVKISRIGFRDSIIETINLQDTIFLLEELSLLNEVVVLPDTNRLTQFIGFKKERNSQSYIAFEGAQFITKIENAFNEERQVKSFVFYVRKSKTRKNAKAKVIFFENENGKPGKQLAIEKVISIENYSKGKIEVDFKETNLMLPKEGFYAGVEWIGCLDEQENEVKSINAEDCQLALIVNDIIGQRILMQSYQRNIFLHSDFYDINKNILDDLSMIPAFGLFLYQ